MHGFLADLPPTGHFSLLQEASKGRECWPSAAQPFIQAADGHLSYQITLFEESWDVIAILDAVA